MNDNLDSNQLRELTAPVKETVCKYTSGALNWSASFSPYSEFMEREIRVVDEYKGKIRDLEKTIDNLNKNCAEHAEQLSIKEGELMGRSVLASIILFVTALSFDIPYVVSDSHLSLTNLFTNWASAASIDIVLLFGLLGFTTLAVIYPARLVMGMERWWPCVHKKSRLAIALTALAMLLPLCWLIGLLIAQTAWFSALLAVLGLSNFSKTIRELSKKYPNDLVMLPGTDARILRIAEKVFPPNADERTRPQLS